MEYRDKESFEILINQLKIKIKSLLSFRKLSLLSNDNKINIDKDIYYKGLLLDYKELKKLYNSRNDFIIMDSIVEGVTYTVIDCFKNKEIYINLELKNCELYLSIY